MWKILTIFCFVPMLITAQNEFTSPTDSDPEAQRILEAIKEQVHAAQDISLDFDFSFEMPGQDSFTTSGTIKEKADHLAVLSSDMEMYSNNEGKWTYSRSTNEVNIDNASEENNNDFFSPREIVKFYESDQFVYAIEDIVKDAGDVIYKMVFKPLDEYIEYSFIKLDVRESKGFTMEKVYVLSKDGSTINLSLTNYKWNTGLTDGDFYFNETLYPNVQIEDLRF